MLHVHTISSSLTSIAIVLPHAEQIMKLLDAQISLPSCLVPPGSHHTEHTLVKILQRKMQIILSKTMTTHNSKKQYTVIYNTTFRELG